MLTVTAAGCRIGGDTGPKRANPAPVRLSAQDVVARTSQRTNQMRSFRITIATTMTFPAAAGLGADANMQMRGRGLVRARPSTAVDLTFSQISVAGHSIGSMREILLGHSVYLRLPAGQMPTSKPWMRVTSGKLGGGVSSPMNNGGDPSSTMAMLSASKDVREVGPETVDGVTTTHYRGTYSMTAALAKLDAKRRAAARGIYQELGLSSMAFDLWIDGNGMPRKVRMASPPGAKLSMDTTVGFNGFNVPTTITAPPRSQVADGDHLGKLPGVLA